MAEFLTFIKKHYLAFFLFFYLIFRLLILNFNSTEWGDSYRILRASNYLIQEGSYPLDEKRPPFYSIILMSSFLFEDEILGARVVMLLISLVIVFLFHRLLQLFFPQMNQWLKMMSLVIFALNPLFLYWSMRIYADTLFLLIFMIFLVIYFDDKFRRWNLLLLPILTVVGIYTRFEGYLLFGSFLAAGIWQVLRFRRQKDLAYIGAYFLVTSLLLWLLISQEYFFYQNPLSSNYFDEAQDRSFDINQLPPTALQFLFLLGNLVGGYFIWRERKKIFKFFLSHPLLLTYFLMFMGLSAFWYPAIPRLFLQILPLYVLVFVFSIHEYLGQKTWKLRFTEILSLLSIIMIYIFGQLHFKAQFLITDKLGFVIVVLLGLICVFSLYMNHKIALISCLVVSQIFWAYFFISDHRYIYSVLNQGVRFLSEKKSPGEIVLSNDVSSLSNYYLSPDLVYSGSLDSGKSVMQSIEKNKASYVLVTNEHNTSLEFSIEKYPELRLIQSYSEEIKGKKFETMILQVLGK